jgi:hypothetical protein
MRLKETLEAMGYDSFGEKLSDYESNLESILDQAEMEVACREDDYFLYIYIGPDKDLKIIDAMDNFKHLVLGDYVLIFEYERSLEKRFYSTEENRYTTTRDCLKNCRQDIIHEREGHYGKDPKVGGSIEAVLKILRRNENMNLLSGSFVEVNVSKMRDDGVDDEGLWDDIKYRVLKSLCSLRDSDLSAGDTFKSNYLKESSTYYMIDKDGTAVSVNSIYIIP